MSRVSISRRTAEIAARCIEVSGGHSLTAYRRAAEELRSALKPKRHVKLARARKTAKRKSKKEQTAEIRAAVMLRCFGFCEECRRPFSETSPAELDHAFGRARAPQAASNCWMLCRECHRDKTNNRPTPAFWAKGFEQHANAHGYFAEAKRAKARFESLQLMEAIP